MLASGVSRCLLALGLLACAVSSHAAIQQPSAGPASGLMSKLKHFELTEPRAVNMMQSSDAASASSIIEHEFEALGRRFHLQLTKNDFFHRDYEQIEMDPQGNILSRTPRSALSLDCYWQGLVVGQEDSFVTASTCDEDSDNHAVNVQDVSASSKLKLRAYVSAFGQQLFVEPAPADYQLHMTPTMMAAAPSVSRNPHIVYRLADLDEGQDVRECGVGKEDHVHEAASHVHTRVAKSKIASLASAISSAASSDVASSSTSSAASSSPSMQAYNGNQNKYVTMGVFNDYNRYLAFGRRVGNHTQQIMNHVAALYHDTSAVSWRYNITIQLKYQVTFTLGDPYDAPPFNGGEANPNKLLENFNTWRKGALQASTIPTIDNGHLLSGYDFFDGTVGLAGVTSMCDPTFETSGGITQAISSNPANTAATVAHEVGHNFGMHHDQVYYGASQNPSPLPSMTQSYVNTNCNDGDNVLDQVMTAVSQAGTIPGKWSPCSRAYIDAFFDGGLTRQYGGAFNLACLEDPLPPAQHYNDSAVVCGDGIREGDEQCDCGARNCAEVDPCCDQATCMLTAGSVCSALDACCDNCQIRAAGYTCRLALHPDCDVAETCDGGNSTCPSNEWATAGTACSSTAALSAGAAGLCFAGKCYSHQQQCLTLGPSISSVTVHGQCAASGDSSNSHSACGQLSCQGTNSKGPGCFTFTMGDGPALVEDGTPCRMTAGSTKQCYNQQCVDSASIDHIVPCEGADCDNVDPVPPAGPANEDDVDWWNKEVNGIKVLYIIIVCACAFVVFACFTHYCCRRSHAQRSANHVSKADRDVTSVRGNRVYQHEMVAMR